MSYGNAVDMFSGELSIVQAKHIFSKVVMDHCPVYADRRHSSVRASAILGRQYTCITRAARKGEIGFSRSSDGDYRFSDRDLADFVLHPNRRKRRAKWTSSEINQLLSGSNPTGRSDSACAVMRSRLKRMKHETA